VVAMVAKQSRFAEVSFMESGKYSDAIGFQLRLLSGRLVSGVPA
jgi:hypothetical protein